ncbi:SDR family oxidoreductase [Bacillaceae bacterium SIJ1]|uniref:elongation factor P 5-aminopentanone reductase n=1 Tax=Litoribacterium kuwaitense TaxID=1398745 RepID=UPI0013EB038F|nr:SDR family oxidoreductase [Litoribacterium kuwaitense]NGP44071.1 SDR family oxidoreductase [Litoribacterium kuwaitense]
MEPVRILVTGASGAIGAALCEQLFTTPYFHKPFQLFGQYYKNKAQMKKLEQRAKETGVYFQSIQANLADVNGPAQCIEALPDRLDVIVHCAGYNYEALLQDTEEREISTLMQVHVISPIALTRHFVGYMAGGACSYARILFISSIWGETGGAMESVYSAAKGAQIAFVKALAKETARSYLTVNAVAPGAIETPMTSHFSPEDAAALIEDIPSGRLGKPEEVARAILFLLNPTSSYINGHVLSINGAWYT